MSESLRLLSPKEVSALLGVTKNRAREVMLSLRHVRVGKLIRIRQDELAKRETRRGAAVIRQRDTQRALSQADRTCRYKYGLTLAERDALLQSQGGACRICERALVRFGSKGSEACVDHCHTTNRVRGVLCNHCNKALGGFFDNAATLRRAADYLAESLDG